MKKPPTPSHTPSLADFVLRAEAPPAPPTPEPAPAYVSLANRVRPVNKENLKRLAYWRRGTEQYWLDQALTRFFAQQDPADLRPIPDAPAAP